MFYYSYCSDIEQLSVVSCREFAYYLLSSTGQTIVIGVTPPADTQSPLPGGNTAHS